VLARDRARRYLRGAFLSWLVFPAEAIAVSGAFLVWATVVGSDAGGGLILFSFGVVAAAAVYGVLATVLVTLPAVRVAEFVGRRSGRRWPGWAAAMGVGLLLAGLPALVIEPATGGSEANALVLLLGFAVMVAPAIVVFLRVAHRTGRAPAVAS
jgi:hypothetical protein